jgi:hypothetical protein
MSVAGNPVPFRWNLVAPDELGSLPAVTSTPLKSVVPRRRRHRGRPVVRRAGRAADGGNPSIPRLARPVGQPARPDRRPGSDPARLVHGRTRLDPGGLRRSHHPGMARRRTAPGGRRPRPAGRAAGDCQPRVPGRRNRGRKLTPNARTIKASNARSCSTRFDQQQGFAPNTGTEATNRTHDQPSSSAEVRMPRHQCAVSNGPLGRGGGCCRAAALRRSLLGGRRWSRCPNRRCSSTIWLWFSHAVQTVHCRRCRLCRGRTCRWRRPRPVRTVRRVLGARLYGV